MKKVLEAELLSIAHRILQMKSKDDVQNLYLEAKELYEKLLILKFHQDNFNLIQPQISTLEMENQLEKAYQGAVTERIQMPLDLLDEEYPIVVEADVETHKKHQEEEDFAQNVATKLEVDVEEEIEEDIAVTYAEPVVNEPFIAEDEKSEVVHYLESEVWTDEDLEEDQQILDENSQEKNNTVSFEEKAEITDDITEVEAVLNQHLINNDNVNIENSQEDFSAEKTLEHSFFGVDYQDVDFVRVEEIDKEQQFKDQMIFEPVAARHNFEGEIPVSETDISQLINEEKKERLKSLNDTFSQNITVSLNDRIAFEKYLFNGSAEDFNRVLSQLNTFNSMDQAIAFIDDLVKPDYNYWTGKEEYVSRLMDLVEKRFA